MTLRTPYLRQGAIASLLLIAIYVFLSFVDQHYPIKEWLFWRYASYWLCSLIWALACFSLGDRIVRTVLRFRLPFLEQLCIDFGVGVLGFGTLIFVCGCLQLFNSVLFFALPLVLIALFSPGFLKYCKRAFYRYRRARAQATRTL
jgi:hypothetical protein